MRFDAGDILSPILPDRLLSWFDKAVSKTGSTKQPKCKIGIFSFYGEDLSTLDADYVVEEPIMIGDLETMEAMWGVYQERAIKINREGYEYHLIKRNCHTVNSALNAQNSDAVQEFANRGFMRFGANSDTITVPKIAERVIRPLKHLQNINYDLSYYMEHTHATDANRQRRQQWKQEREAALQIT